MGLASTIRDGVYDKITADLAASNYTINDCNLEKTFFPQEDLEDLGAKPYIKVVSMPPGAERNRQLRYQEMVTLELSVQVAIQQRVDHKNVTYLDQLTSLVEDVMDAVEDDELVASANYVWVRTEPLRDENGLVYSYEELSVEGIFNSIFNIYYTYLKES